MEKPKGHWHVMRWPAAESFTKYPESELGHLEAKWIYKRAGRAQPSEFAIIVRGEVLMRFSDETEAWAALHLLFGRR